MLQKNKRLKVVRALYECGICSEDIAKLLAVSGSTVRNDLAFLRETAQPGLNHPPRSRAFRNALETIVGLIKDQPSSLTDDKEFAVLLSKALDTWLQVSEIFRFIEGVFSGLDYLTKPEIADQDKGYHSLLLKILRRQQKQNSSEGQAEKSWYEYLCFLANSPTEPVPTDIKSLQRELTRYLCHSKRSAIMPNCPASILRSEVDGALGALEERERHILRLHFGLDGEAITLAQIPSRLGSDISGECIRQIEQRGLRKLQRPQNARRLKILLFSMGNLVVERLENRRVLERSALLEEKLIEIEILPPDEVDKRVAILLKPISELELSVRTANCLQNAHILYAGDLADKTGKEILMIRNMGRKGVRELRNIFLNQLGITLGERLSLQVRSRFLEVRTQT